MLDLHWHTYTCTLLHVYSTLLLVHVSQKVLKKCPKKCPRQPGTATKVPQKVSLQARYSHKSLQIKVSQPARYSQVLPGTAIVLLQTLIKKWSHMRSVPEHFIGDHEASLLGSLALLFQPAADGSSCRQRAVRYFLDFLTSAPDHASIPRKVGPQPRTLGTDPPRRRPFGAVQLNKPCISFATVGTDTLYNNIYCWVVFLWGTPLFFYFGKQKEPPWSVVSADVLNPKSGGLHSFQSKSWSLFKEHYAVCRLASGVDITQFFSRFQNPGIAVALSHHNMTTASTQDDAWNKQTNKETIKCKNQTNNALEVPTKCDNIYRLRSPMQM